MSQPYHDEDPAEIQEWQEALASVLRNEGPERAQFLLSQLALYAQQNGVTLGTLLQTSYINTINVADEPAYPGDRALEKQLLAMMRWNAVAMVLRAGKKNPELGGHIATYASAAMLYEVGFQHFFHAATDNHGGDLLYIQGHSSPGIYARAFLEGRLSEDQLVHFRQEVDGKGLSSYPHPWLMPDFWQFATVSMGLGPLQGIYQARFLKYLHHRGLADTANRKVWVFCGDGEMDEPESLGALSIAAREKLDNLIFVINCNLQRLDGPVRGNSKIIQELEGVFHGAGWNVLKVLWGRHWDPLLAQDKTGLLIQRMNECIDGEYQNYKAKDGAYVRQHFFGKYPELAKLVADMSDDEIWRLNRGGHDAGKVYAAYQKAMQHQGQPTVILAKTIKGYGMGAAGEGLNITHQQKKMSTDALKAFCSRFDIPVPEAELEKIPFYRPDDTHPAIQYLKAQRKKLGGSLPSRRIKTTENFTIPDLHFFDTVLNGSGEREISTTMAFVRLLTTLLKEPQLGPRIVPIVPDESRTFGMEGLFRQIGIYSPVGQLYEPVDKDQVMYYREDKAGQILEEGINEAGAFCSWLAASTSYSVSNLTMIPFFIYYSMFGFQRIGDLAFAAGDMKGRGFLLGATAGRTTLAGEGLQHQDGHSHIMASTIPNCINYDPCYGYELAVIIHDGLRRMVQNQENIFYYITLMNENYVHPALPAGCEQGILRGMYRLKAAAKAKHQVTLLGSGTILREVLRAAEELATLDIGSDIFSVTSFTELRREAQALEREHLLHPEKPVVDSFVTTTLKQSQGPIIAATDYMRLLADQIRPYVPRAYTVLGTDGYGRSDTRTQLRHFFEVDYRYIVIASLTALADSGEIKASVVTDAIKRLALDPNKLNPQHI